MGNTAYCECVDSAHDTGESIVPPRDTHTVYNPIPGGILNTTSPITTVQRHREEFEGGGLYEGSIVDSYRQGQGDLWLPQVRLRYTGSWKRGVPHGEGEETLNGYSYKGSFMEGRKEGKGKLTCPDGSVFQGYFRDDLPVSSHRVMNPNIQSQEGMSLDVDRLQLVPVQVQPVEVK